MEYRVKLKDLTFSLSGMENQVKRLLAEGEAPANVARFTLDTVCSVVLRATQEAQRRCPRPAGAVLRRCGLQPTAAGRHGEELRRPVRPALLLHGQRHGGGHPDPTGPGGRGAGMREETILSPSQVSGYIKSWMDRDRLLSGLLVRGELSNYKMYPSGHHYFTLKDSQGALRCVMFRGDAASLRFRPENGMQVIAAGRITVFPRDGQYQLYCVRLTPEGAGDLHVAFEQLKEKLLREGLFDQAHKRPLPAYPRRIALITSPAGAAVRDMLRILGARYPLAQVRVLPGAGAGGGGGGGDRRRPGLGQPPSSRRPDHHRPGGRLHGGPVGL